MIYAVEIQDKKFVKIGYSSNEDVNARIAALQTGNPFEIKPIFTTFGSLMQEKTIHAELTTAFGRIRVPMPPNEWYPGRAPFFVGFLDYFKYGPDAAIAYLQHYSPEMKQPSNRPGRTNVSPNYLWGRPIV